MDFANTTGGNARFLNTVMGEEDLLGCVIARPTFRVDGEKLIATPDVLWPIEAEPFDTPAGSFPGDVPFLTGGVDVFVLGSAMHPDAGSGPTLDVEIRVGERFQRRIRVFGDRRWERGATGLVASDPEPFETMPLDYEHAFGGGIQTEYGEHTCGMNAVGKGYYLDEEQAEGQPLPNLEDPEHLIASFEDKPDPVGTAPYPREGGLFANNAADFDLDDPEFPTMTQLKPLVFNHAHPRMIIPPAAAPLPGDEVVVTHVVPEGELRFGLPDTELHAHVQLGERHSLFPLHLDGIGILVGERRVFLSYRVVYRYRMVRMERRMATLYAGPLPAGVPNSYVRNWEEERPWA